MRTGALRSSGSPPRASLGGYPQKTGPQPVTSKPAAKVHTDGGAIRGLLVAVALAVPFWLAGYLLLR
jgi:hypothetical protein